MGNDKRVNTQTEFLSLMNQGMKYGPDAAFGMSPYYSRINLVHGGVEAEPVETESNIHYRYRSVADNSQCHVFLVYNRTPLLLLESLVKKRYPVVEQRVSLDAISSLLKCGDTNILERTTFSGPDVIRYDISGVAPGIDLPSDILFETIFRPDPGLPWKMVYDGDREIVLEGEKERGDKRDIKKTIPFHIVIRQSFPIEGRVLVEDDMMAGFAPGVRYETILKEQVKLQWLWNGPGYLDFGFGVGSDTVGNTRQAVFNSQNLNTTTTVERLRKWWSSAIGDLDLNKFKPEHRKMASKAAYGLLSNTILPHEKFSPYHACFPCRKAYACHFLWDSCFQNLALLDFRPDLAKQSLSLLIRRMEMDSKMPHFCCATWNRPGASQPPLIGWSAWHIYRRRKDKEFLKSIYEGLVRNMHWFDTKRDDDGDGVYEYMDGLESGWDNSPRWDFGVTEPLDLNAFLVLQQRLMAEMAREMKNNEDVPRWADRSDALAQHLVDEFYDWDKHAFYDRLFDTHEKVTVLTPAAFIPLWVDVPLEKSEAKRTIEEHLLNPDEFWGEIPFPSVAYNDPLYTCDNWWRGPLWPNVAWLMTEVLKKYGYLAEWKESLRRLEKLFMTNGECYEFFDSRTGRGMGSPQLGWGCAICYKVFEEQQLLEEYSI